MPNLSSKFDACRWAFHSSAVLRVASKAFSETSNAFVMKLIRYSLQPVGQDISVGPQPFANVPSVRMPWHRSALRPGTMDLVRDLSFHVGGTGRIEGYWLRPKIVVTADGRGVMGSCTAGLLTDLADATRSSATGVRTRESQHHPQVGQGINDNQAL